MKKYYEKDLMMKDLLELFTEKRIKENNQWHEGVLLYAPSTNSPNEGYNAHLKKTVLRKKQCLFQEFLEKTIEDLNKSEHKNVSKKPTYKNLNFLDGTNYINNETKYLENNDMSIDWYSDDKNLKKNKEINMKKLFASKDIKTLSSFL